MIRIILIFSVLLIKTGYSPKNLEQNYERAYFASGCFWCVEGIYENVKGVIKVNSGYSGGRMKNPTYQQVISGRTGHAETVEIIYDPEIIDFKTLVNVFFGSHDPSTLNRQGPDRGTQYRSIAFYNSKNEKNEIENEINRLLNNNSYNNITTQVIPFKIFYLAEEYHQDYKKNNPNDMYIMKVSAPRINKFKINFPELIK